MKSPNPSGRPKGIVDRRSRITQALLDGADAVVQVVKDAAAEGDMQACGLIMSRIAPALKAESDRVAFPFDSKASLAEQTEAVLQAIADGKVSADTGSQIISAINHLGGIRQVDQLQARLEALERLR